MSGDPLQELIDRERIRDLLARYPMAFDDRDWTAWDELWTDDLGGWWTGRRSSASRLSGSSWSSACPTTTAASTCAARW